MIKLVSRFSLLITLLLGISFSLHLLALNSLSFPLYENKIIASYLVNLILTIVIFIALIKLKERFAESLGYIFFVGSFLKFIVFFIVIYPSYKEDGDVTKLEFTSFFIPYAISLIFEVTFLVKTLNKEG